jgi:hypothetical protein
MLKLISINNRFLFQTLLTTERKNMMKKLFGSTMIVLVFLIVLASTSFAASAVTEKELLFKGTLRAVETHVVTFPTFSLDATGSGNATQLGLYTMSFQGEVFIPTLSGTTTAVLVAADGSSLYADGVGQGTATENPDFVSIVETYTITGGTGRFAGASGSFTVERLIQRSTGISSGTISGTIVLP